MFEVRAWKHFVLYHFLVVSELCRQLIKLNPRKLILFDNSEYNLYKINSELNSFSDIISILGSVDNYNFLNIIFNKYKIDTLYHAAAYKHVPLVESNILNGIYNNIIGWILNTILLIYIIIIIYLTSYNNIIFIY